MQKFYIMALSCLMAVTTATAGIGVKASERLKRMNDAGRSYMAIGGHNVRTAGALQLQAAGMMAAPMLTPQRAVDTEGANATLTAPTYGMLYGPDGEDWFYTMNPVYGNFYRLKSCEVAIYDANHKQVGTINYTVPEGSTVNSFYPYGQVTKKMFDRDDKTLEVVLYAHYLGENYVNTDSTFIYNLSGERVLGYEGMIGSVFNIQQNSWSSYQRAILQRSDLRLDEATGRSYLQFDVLKPAGWGETEPTVEHTFEVDYDLMQYSDGACFTQYEVDGEPYYVISHYNETFVESIDPNTYDLVIRKDNPYVIESYNKNYERVDSFGVKLDTPENAICRMACMGTFSDEEVTKGLFSGDEGMNYIVTSYDYIVSSDDYIYRFDVYNGKGEIVKTICDNVSDFWSKLADIDGHESQWMFLQNVGTTQQLKMVDLPSCTVAQTIPATIGGETVSTTLNRYPKGDSYQYAIKSNFADTDGEGNVIARIVWYNKDLTRDHAVDFNLGPNGQYFSPLLTDQTLNPYTFDTDDGHEYCFLAKIKRTDSSVLDNVMVIANEDGTVIREFRGDDNKGIYTGGILNYGTANSEFFVVTMTTTGAESYDLAYYQLPFSRFTAGGDGTKGNPYLVSTLGDMQQMATLPAASFKIVNDIDMSGYPDTWTPIKSFTGTIDGDGHALRNFRIKGDEFSSGLFGSLDAGSKIENLVIINPELTVGKGASYVGIVAGQAMTDTLRNVHVYGAELTGTGGESVGGLVGKASVFSLVEGSSFEGNINLPATEQVGGIVGNTRTSSYVKASTVSGKLTAAAVLGGIVGETGNDGAVSDCHVNADITAGNTVGGIVGVDGSRAAVTRCFAEGTITATTPSKWYGMSTGGIVGSLTSGVASTDTIVSCCVAASAITVPKTANDNTTHLIVGWSVANESLEAGERPQTEKGLVDNYATGTVNGAVSNSADETSVQGANILAANLTTDFFVTLGYKFGSAVDAPWVAAAQGVGLPSLWFENTVRGIGFDRAAIEVVQGETGTLTVTVYGADASEISLASSDESVATIEITDETDNSVTFTVEGKTCGEAVITATAAGFTDKCVVSVVAPSGIDEAVAVANDMKIRLHEGRISASGAAAMGLYDASGRLAARANGDTVGTVGLAKGLYIVVARAADGHTTTSKVIVK